jgi:hypothetical protein
MHTGARTLLSNPSLAEWPMIVVKEQGIGTTKQGQGEGGIESNVTCVAWAVIPIAITAGIAILRKLNSSKVSCRRRERSWWWRGTGGWCRRWGAVIHIYANETDEAVSGSAIEAPYWLHQGKRRAPCGPVLSVLVSEGRPKPNPPENRDVAAARKSV